MRFLLRSLVIHIFSLWFVSEIFPALVVPDKWQELFLAGFILTLLTLFLQPLLKILFIPLNILTFGLASWAIHVIVLYLLTLLFPTIQIREWTFLGWNGGGFAIPQYTFSPTLALVLASFLIAFFVNSLNKISEA